MAGTTHSSQDTHKGINPFSAGVMGTAIGVALGATTVALSDKSNRKKMAKTVSDLKKQTFSKMNVIKAKTADLDIHEKGKALLNGHKKTRARKTAVKK